jgi:hypothetical protein
LSERKEKSSKGEQGQMKAEYEQHWHEVAQEVLLEMRTWREEHPTATMQQIEEEVDKRIARMRAGLVEGLAMSSAAAEVGSRASDQPACCPTCGGVLQARGKQVRKLTTTGEQTVRLERSYGYCPTCQVGFFPLDEQLGLRPKVGFTPKVEEGMARLGTWMPFRAAQRELAFFLGVEVAEATVRQITEQAGAAQMQGQAAEVEALLRERPDSPVGPAVQLLSLDGALIQLVKGEWKEVKTLALGVVSETKNKREGEAQVQTTALSYFSRMSEAESFQQEALGELYRRGVEKAEKVCAVSDGADWIQKWVDYHRKDAVRILDFAHAMEYVSKGGQAASEHIALPQQDQALDRQGQAKRQQERLEQWLQAQGHELKTGEAHKVLAELERLRTLMQETGHLGAVETLDKSLYYLRERREMIRYARFRAQGYPIGSGSVESANKLVVQSRMKQAGMRWDPSHVNPMLAMRNLACNARWMEGWRAIRQLWQNNEMARRAQRAVRASSSGERAAPVPPAVLPHPEPAASSEPVPPLLTPTKQPSHPAPEPRPVRPAPTHPWRRPFLRRRSA